MSWIKVVKEGRDHHCKLPSNYDILRRDAIEGSQWKCRKCQTVYILRDKWNAIWAVHYRVSRLT